MMHVEAHVRDSLQKKKKTIIPSYRRTTCDDVIPSFVKKDASCLKWLRSQTNGTRNAFSAQSYTGFLDWYPATIATDGLKIMLTMVYYCGVVCGDQNLLYNCYNLIVKTEMNDWKRRINAIAGNPTKLLQPIVDRKRLMSLLSQSTR